MENRSDNPHPVPSRAVYRWAFFIAMLTFPLIWLGGLVTTHDAGMAVPDWPGTFGYNLFLYPWTTWLFGPFDLLVEHGHRLLAALVGFLAIVLVFVSRKSETRPWAHRLSWLFLLAVISQGLLGGIRVLLDQRIVALIHGCVGPLVFALACLIVMVNSREWHSAVAKRGEGLASSGAVGAGIRWVARMLFPLTIVQLILGAHLRHALPTWRPALFVSFVHTHLLFATLITLLILAAFLAVHLPKYRHVGVRAPARWLSVLLVVQVGLGLGTWVANYALPWPEWNAFFANYTIAGRGFWETMIINGHQATGSLLIVCSLWLLCRVERRSAASRSETVLSRSSNPTSPVFESRRAEFSS
ncbi:COX15/CtaA family protein [Pirellulaceae bacterium SH501]